jgi:hypothetical protein
MVSKKDGGYGQMTMFADRLVMPRAVMPFGDGVLASVPPNLIYDRNKRERRSRRSQHY